MQPVIEELDEKKVIGVGGAFISILSPDRNNMVVVPKLWETFVARANEITPRRPGFSMGVCGDPPDGVARTRDDEFYYVAGAEVETLDSIPEGMTGVTIPAGRYARFTHKGKINGLAKTMRYIHAEWLPGSGHRRRNGVPEIEVYDHSMDPTSDDFRMEVWLPLE